MGIKGLAESRLGQWCPSLKDWSLIVDKKKTELLSGSGETKDLQRRSLQLGHHDSRLWEDTKFKSDPLTCRRQLLHYAGKILRFWTQHWPVGLPAAHQKLRGWPAAGCRGPLVLLAMVINGEPNLPPPESHHRLLLLDPCPLTPYHHCWIPNPQTPRCCLIVWIQARAPGKFKTPGFKV